MYVSTVNNQIPYILLNKLFSVLPLIIQACELLSTCIQQCLLNMYQFASFVPCFVRFRLLKHLVNIKERWWMSCA